MSEGNPGPGSQPRNPGPGYPLSRCHPRLRARPPRDSPPTPGWPPGAERECRIRETPQTAALFFGLNHFNAGLLSQATAGVTSLNPGNLLAGDVPFGSLLDGGGTYVFNVPQGVVPPGLQLQTVSVVTDITASPPQFVVSNVRTVQF